MSEPTNFQQAPEPLALHRYPTWVIGSAGLMVLAVLYSLFVLPKYYEAAYLLDKANKADAAQNTQAAANLLEKALQHVPDSKKLRLQLAYEDFKLPSEEAHERAMDALNGVTVDDDEWAILVKVMPMEYQNQFQRTDDGK